MKFMLAISDPCKLTLAFLCGSVVLPLPLTPSRKGRENSVVVAESGFCHLC